MSSGLASGGSKGVAWSGKDGDFVDQLVDLRLTRYLDIKTEYDISVGKGGPCCKFYHHYIVLESSYLPISSNRLIFELAKESDFMGKSKVVPNVRKFSRDGEPDYKITVKTTLRKLAELASEVMYLLGPYNLITASCQTFSDKFLKQLGSGGYMTYVKAGIVAAVVAGIAATGALLLSWLSSGGKNQTEEEEDNCYDSDSS